MAVVVVVVGGLPLGVVVCRFMAAIPFHSILLEGGSYSYSPSAKFGFPPPSGLGLGALDSGFGFGFWVCSAHSVGVVGQREAGANKWRQRPMTCDARKREWEREREREL